MILASIEDITSVLCDAKRSIAVIEAIRENLTQQYYLKHRHNKGDRDWRTLWITRRKEDETEHAFAMRTPSYNNSGPYGTLRHTAWGACRFKHEEEYRLLNRLIWSLDTIVSYEGKGASTPKITLTTEQVSAIYQLYA